VSYSEGLSHKSVMLKEVLEFLAPEKNDVIIDGTFGAGGYSSAILDASECSVIGIDRDPDIDNFVKQVEIKYGERFKFIPGCFGDLESIVEENAIQKINGVVLDLGVSSMQLEEADRGFSFNLKGELDMRMGKHGTSAKDVVNSFSEKDLADLIYLYGDERNSRKIAKAIVTERRKEPITGTKQLSWIISTVNKRAGKIDPATKTFQALRIWVNQELEEINKILESLPKFLTPGARVVVVSFHSLEDRIIKNFLRNNKGLFHILTKKVVKPSREEIRSNNKSRSAVLRAAVYKGVGE